MPLKRSGAVNRAARVAARRGTTGYHPCTYDRSVQYCRKADRMLVDSANCGDEGFAEYDKVARWATPATDVFCLAIVFLCILLRSGMHSSTWLWIVRELSVVAPSSSSSSSASSSSSPASSSLPCHLGLQCTPAHVLMFHHDVRSCVNDTFVNAAGKQTKLKPSHDFFADKKERQRHNALLERVQKGEVSISLFDLLHSMLHSSAGDRPPIQAVIDRLRAEIRGSALPAAH